MKRAIYSDKFSDGETVWQVNGSEEYGCYREILATIKGQLTAMSSHHSRLLVVRVDLHLSSYSPDNRELSRFLDKIRKHCRAKYKAKRLGYLWVREQEKAKQQHYHLALILDGNRIKHPSALLAWICVRWEARNHPRPFVPEHCFYNVKRANQASFKEVFKRLSYFAKTRGKGYRSPTANDYSSSRIKPKG